MTTTTVEIDCLFALRTALGAIAAEALKGYETATTCEDALDVLQALESAARVAVLEHFGQPMPDLYEIDTAGEYDPHACPSEIPF